MIQASAASLKAAADVRFGSKADICSATAHVRFTPNSDRESGFPQQAMSALPPKADMCGATRDVRFENARGSLDQLVSTLLGCKRTSSPSAFAVLRLITITKADIVR
jgi:hypothetical protein